MLKKILNTDDAWAPVAVRLALAVVMFPHGAQKVLGWWGGYGYSATLQAFTDMGFPAPLAVLAFAAEFLGPLALALGLLTRIAALGIGATMLVAAAKVHLSVGFFMNWSGTQRGEGL